MNEDIKKLPSGDFVVGNHRSYNPHGPLPTPRKGDERQDTTSTETTSGSEPDAGQGLRGRGQRKRPLLSVVRGHWDWEFQWDHL